MSHHFRDLNGEHLLFAFIFIKAESSHKHGLEVGISRETGEPKTPNH